MDGVGGAGANASLLSTADDEKSCDNDANCNAYLAVVLSFCVRLVACPQLDRDSVNLIGDVLVAASSIAYLGPFTPDFREALVKQWQQCLEDFYIVHTMNCTISTLLADPTTVRQRCLRGVLCCAVVLCTAL